MADAESFPVDADGMCTLEDAEMAEPPEEGGSVLARGVGESPSEEVRDPRSLDRAANYSIRGPHAALMFFRDTDHVFFFRDVPSIWKFSNSLIQESDNAATQISMWGG